MIRPYPLFLFLVLGCSDYLQQPTNLLHCTGVIVWLCIVPSIIIVVAAVTTSKFRKSNRKITELVPVLSAALILISWGVAVMFMSWMQLVRFYIGDTVILDELLTLIPAVAALALLWFVTGSRGSRREMLSHRIRFDLLLFLVPMLFILALREATIHFDYVEYVQIVEAASIILVIVFAPFILAAILPAHPMQDQELRQTMLDIGVRAGVRLQRILVWNTHQRLMNALAIGIVPWWRVVVLSDKLISHVTPRELHAVASHEIGHHRFKHSLFLCLVVLGVLFWSEFLLDTFMPSVGEIWLMVVQLSMMIIAVVLVSRQFERQADTYAAVDLSRTQGSSTITEDASMAMAGALGAIAWVHRIPTSRNEPLHGSIESRQQYLESIVGTPVASLPIDRNVRRIKALAILLIVSGILL